MVKTKIQLPKELIDCLEPSKIRNVHPWGHGDWFHPSDRALLESICKDCNSRYGANSHRVEDLSKRIVEAYK